MRAPALFVLCLVCGSAKPATPASKQAEPTRAGKDDCSAEDVKVNELTAQLAAAQAELQKLKGKQNTQSEEISVVDTIFKMRSIAGDVVEHILQQTEMDEHVITVVSAKVGLAKEFTASATAFLAQVTDQIKSADFESFHKRATSNEIYLLHIAPHVQTLTKSTYINDYVHPTIEKAKHHIHPAMETAKTHFTTVAQAMQRDVLPTLKQKSKLAVEHISGVASNSHKHLAPAVDFIVKAAPKTAKFLPKQPMDQLLCLLIVALLVYNLFFIARFVLRFTLRITAKLTVLMLRILLALGIKLPLKITGKTVSWTFFFATGFHVCGLCSRRKSSKVAEKDGKPAKADAKNATVKELQALLETSKAKGKLDEGVKSLCKMIKQGKPLATPKDMEGKTVTKEALKQALTKFKEVEFDLKKLGLGQ